MTVIDNRLKYIRMLISVIFSVLFWDIYHILRDLLELHGNSWVCPWFTQLLK